MTPIAEVDGYKVTRLERFGRFTIAQVEDDDGRKATGLSRCSFLDKFDENRGQNIAVGRACKALAKKLTHNSIHDAFMG